MNRELICPQQGSQLSLELFPRLGSHPHPRIWKSKDFPSQPRCSPQGKGSWVIPGWIIQKGMDDLCREKWEKWDQKWDQRGPCREIQDKNGKKQDKNGKNGIKMGSEGSVQGNMGSKQEIWDQNGIRGVCAGKYGIRAAPEHGIPSWNDSHSTVTPFLSPLAGSHRGNPGKSGNATREGLKFHLGNSKKTPSKEEFPTNPIYSSACN